MPIGGLKLYCIEEKHGETLELAVAIMNRLEFLGNQTIYDFINDELSYPMVKHTFLDKILLSDTKDGGGLFLTGVLSTLYGNTDKNCNNDLLNYFRSWLKEENGYTSDKFMTKKLRSLGFYKNGNHRECNIRAIIDLVAKNMDKDISRLIIGESERLKDKIKTYVNDADAKLKKL